MKRFFALFLSLIVVAGAFMPTAELKADSQRMLLIEGFTNAYCPPCPPPYKTFKEYAETYPDVVIPVTMHFYYPGINDAHYQANIPMSQQRLQQYYGVNGVPNYCFNGDGPVHTSYIANRHPDAKAIRGVISPHDIDVNLTKKAGGGDVTVTVATSAGLHGQMLRIYVVESECHYASQLGSNGEKDFFWVSRDMLPNTDGTSLSISTGQSQEFNFSYSNKSQWLDVNNIYIVAFIQDDGSPKKEVLQAATSLPKPMMVEASAEVKFKSASADSDTEMEFTATNPNESNVYVQFSVDTDASYIPQGWTVKVSPTANESLGAGESKQGVVTFSPNGIAGYCEAIIKVDGSSAGKTVYGTTIMLSAMSDNVKNLMVLTGSASPLSGFNAFASIPGFAANSTLVPANASFFEAVDPASFDNAIFGYDYGTRGSLGANPAACTFIREMLEAGKNVIVSGELELYNAYQQTASPEGKYLFNNILGITYAEAPVMRVKVNSQNEITEIFVTPVKGVAGDPIGQGINFKINESTQLFEIFTDIIKINTPAKTNMVLYYDNNPTKGAAVRTEYMGGKLFFMTFGFEALANTADRTTLMGKIYDWFNYAPPSDPVLSCADELGFGEIEAGKTLSKKLRIDNTGDADLIISEAIISGADRDQFTMIGTIAGAKIPAGDYKNVTVSFVPSEEGNFSSVLTIVSNSSDVGVKTVSITGSATPNGIEDFYGSDAELLTMSVGPNPFAVSTELTYTLNSTSSKHFDIVVIDASGREVLSAFSGQVTPGTNEITLSAGNLAAGNYFITARTEGFNTQIPLIIIK